MDNGYGTCNIHSGCDVNWLVIGDHGWRVGHRRSDIKHVSMVGSVGYILQQKSASVNMCLISETDDCLRPVGRRIPESSEHDEQNVA